MKNMLFIAAGGALGALARVGFSKLVHRLVNDVFPWGTLAVNLSGCFLIGFFFELFEHSLIPSSLRSLITIGFLGAYTTFSTYSLETVSLLREGELRLCLTNVLLSNILGIGMALLGIAAARIGIQGIR